MSLTCGGGGRRRREDARHDRQEMWGQIARRLHQALVALALHFCDHDGEVIAARKGEDLLEHAQKRGVAHQNANFRL